MQNHFISLPGKNYTYEDTVVIPIIENTPEEFDLQVSTNFYGLIACMFIPVDFVMTLTWVWNSFGDRIGVLSMDS